MNEYSFMIAFKKEEAEPAFMDCEAEGWNEPVTHEKIINDFAKPYIESYLAHAFVARGYLFNAKKHSPCQLYQALLNNPEWEVTVDGVNCELPDPLVGPHDIPPDLES